MCGRGRENMKKTEKKTNFSKATKDCQAGAVVQKAGTKEKGGRLWGGK